jgi:hypothetical protein
MNLNTPTDLPINTVIKDSEKGLHIKDQMPNGDLFWMPCASHCVDCREEDRIPDSEANEKFKNFELISLPFGVTWQFALAMGDQVGRYDEEGNPVYYEDFVVQAIEGHNRVLEQIKNESKVEGPK